KKAILLYNMKEFLKEELSGWKKWEICWLLIATISISIINIILEHDIISLIAALTGIICIILAGKGKLSTYIFAIIHIITYALILYNSKYYGLLMLNILYYLPMQFYGFYEWGKNMNPDTHEVYKKKMSLRNTVILLISVFALTVLYGLFLQLLNGNLPFVDALSTVVAIIALYISIKMYTEQWLLWIIVNIVTVIMWIYALNNGNGSVVILIMTLIYLINSIIMYFKWKNESDNL
ncbi:nicotinamide riboside transporter PnuC, partial [uncultured Methanobrevibacter sp.]|uniref:nicotinamide riboside transporter PnuC n=1 Tax=uncultured Methanobrevibacter sp. TaxID=253161 RepID=UPI0025DE7DCA